MHFTSLLAVVASLASLTEAWNGPNYSGFTRTYNANFIGAKGTQPGKWNIITGDKNDNNEYQRFTSSTKNLLYSGDGTLQIIPLKDSKAPKGWTSARIESQYTVTPKAGRITRIEASIRVGGNAAANKQGIWPAFWMQGDSYRHGTAWPACGELDIFENINGLSTAYGVVHCDKYPNGICNEPVGLVKGTTLSDSKFHKWRLDIDRRSSDYKKQTLTWYMDGKQFQRVTGAEVASSTVWASLAQKPLYFIINVSVGGNWPGAPNSKTLGGAGSMMELGYVAVYTSNQ